MFLPADLPLALVTAVGTFVVHWAGQRHWAQVFGQWQRDREERGLEVVLPRQPSTGEAAFLAIALVAMSGALFLVHGPDGRPCSGDLALVPVRSEGTVHVLWNATCSEPVGTSLLTHWTTGSPGDELVPWDGPSETVACEDATSCTLVSRVPVEPGECLAVASSVTAFRAGDGFSTVQADAERCLPR